MVTRFGPVAPHSPAPREFGRPLLLWPLAAAVAGAVLFGGWRSHVGRVYSSTATLLFEVPITIVTTQGVSIDFWDHLGHDLSSFAEMIRSPRIRQRVLSNLTAEDHRILLRAAAKHSPNSADLLGEITTSGDSGGTLLRVTAESADPEAAALVANKFVRAFLAEFSDDSRSTDDYAAQFLQKQAAKLKQGVDTDVAQVNRLRATGVGDEAKEMQLALSQVGTAQSNYRAMQNRLEQTRESRAHTRLPARPLDAAVPNPHPIIPTPTTVLRQSLLAGIAIFAIAGLLTFALQRPPAGKSASAKAT
ncbi:MAG TPA: hypothetical protein VHV47_08530 [Opitutaceae bacterium]|nr:hypothetical protein [Opitutaceae bacterium]